MFVLESLSIISYLVEIPPRWVVPSGKVGGFFALPLPLYLLPSPTPPLSLPSSQFVFLLGNK